MVSSIVLHTTKDMDIATMTSPFGLGESVCDLTLGYYVHLTCAIMEELNTSIKRGKWKQIGHKLRKPESNITRHAPDWNPQGLTTNDDLQKIRPGKISLEEKPRLCCLGANCRSPL